MKTSCSFEFNMRVVSLLPSATDTVCALGLSESIVGRSHECDDEGVQGATICTENKVEGISQEDLSHALSACNASVSAACRSGCCDSEFLIEYGLSVYKLDVEKLKHVKPEIILTQMQGVGPAEDEPYKFALELALGYCPKIVHLAAANLKETWEDVQKISDALGQNRKGKELIKKLHQRLETARESCVGRKSPKVACFQWLNPLFSGSAWVPELIRLVGGQDVVGKVEEAVQVTTDQLKEANPDVVVVAVCGMNLKKGLENVREQAAEFVSVLPKTSQLAVVDGERLFSRPGPLLADSIEALVEILHPEAQVYGYHGQSWKMWEE
ncbi:hypothetical protein BSKO_09927 [Bryopsis sp. KO-2023]|nr:hypothetical protein BSKO_09927 [Bryopsis sp. KO-2023]